MKNINKIISFSVIGTMLISSTSVYALSKDETVYAKLNNDGSVKNTTVVEHVSDNKNIEDITDLKNILNINGDEEFTTSGEKLCFMSNDIFYQGTTDKELPVSLNITYKLDGEDIKLDDLLGKSGSVTINVKYTNNEKHSVKINGKYETLYTPFVVTTGMIISNNNKNIEISNGKVINNGISNIAVGIASPGLSDSLNINVNTNETVINMSTDSFELPTIYIVVTSSLLNDENLDVFDKLDNVYGIVNTLSDSSKLLVQGSNKLNNGLLEYQTNFKSFNDGVSSLSSGSDKLYNAYSGINTGINSIYDDVKNLSTLISSVNELSEGISKLTYLTNSIASNSQDITDTVNSTVSALENHIKSLSVIAATTTDVNTKKAIVDEITSLQSQLDLEKLNDLQGNINTLNSALTTLDTNMKTLNDKTSNLGKALSALITGITNLKTGSNTFYSKLGELNTSIKTISGYSTKLNTGINVIVDGSNELTVGITTFDSDGIEKIASLVNNDVSSLATRVQELTKLANDYDTFTKNNNNDDAQTKFILMIDGEKKQEEVKTNEVVKTEKLSLWQRILNLFK